MYKQKTKYKKSDQTNKQTQNGQRNKFSNLNFQIS